MEELFLSRNFDVPNAHTMRVYEANGGYQAMRKAFEMDGATIIDEVKKSNLRGRGGAGFPTGVKWGFMPKESDVPMYLTVNADEGEPGTFKDRYCMELDPHRLIEGCIITAYALGIRYGYIYVRGELQNALKILQKAIDECYEKGYLGENIQGQGFDFDLYVHSSAGAYICGEETGMIEGLEGKPGQPRLKPPFPAIVGVFGAPTLVNNVESISSIPFIIERGGEWFASMGVEKNGGPKLYGLSGHIKKPGVYEAPTGITVRELLEDYGGGMLDGSELKAFIPGGSSCAVLTPEALDAPMSFEGMREYGSTMGTGCITFMDQNTCMVRVAARLAHFYHHESCGQCTPCREGSGWASKVLDAVEAGRGREEDVKLLLDMVDNVQGNTICALGDALAIPVRSYIQVFPEEFQEHIDKGCCPYPSWGKFQRGEKQVA
ncbi:MAG: NADH-quinone oxidoreductase subunit NuoF [Persicimonas sp.]